MVAYLLPDRRPENLLEPPLGRERPRVRKEEMRCLLDDEVGEVIGARDSSSVLSEAPEHLVEDVGSDIVDLIPAPVEAGDYGFCVWLGDGPGEAWWGTCAVRRGLTLPDDPQPKLVDCDYHSVRFGQRPIFGHDLIVVAISGVVAMRVVELIESPSEMKRLLNGVASGGEQLFGDHVGVEPVHVTVILAIRRV